MPPVRSALQQLQQQPHRVGRLLLAQLQGAGQSGDHLRTAAEQGGHRWEGGSSSGRLRAVGASLSEPAAGHTQPGTGFLGQPRGQADGQLCWRPGEWAGRQAGRQVARRAGRRAAGGHTRMSSLGRSASACCASLPSRSRRRATPSSAGRSGQPAPTKPSRAVTSPHPSIRRASQGRSGSCAASACRGEV